MRYLPQYFDSNELYFLMDNFLMFGVSIYIFKKSQKTILNLFFSAACIIIFSYSFFDYLQMIVFNRGSFEILNYFIFVAITLIVYVLIFRNRYKWERLKSDNYQRNKIQAIYSKPDEALTLLGAATSLSPKCSVRYTYNDKTIRFKRGNKTPILCDTVINKTDIIKTTNINTSLFFDRFEEIKNRKYNLLTFNCKNLF
ncbi:unnamed protein product [marine sediment metagenome]|jgi:hypothetical protein|uniref:Uncharacterized protein n=1 Tax=marine sediment metagenome TaxID=412755 RepID=X0TIC6_9ZZZZ